MSGKRKTNESRIPVVEKLYRQNQESYFEAGGFDAGDDEYEEKREKIAEAAQKRRDLPFEKLETPDSCQECQKPLYDSWLWEKFSFAICDSCRDDTDKHKLIARTEAKTKFLLKDCDFDLRKPVLRFISKKNPHNPRYGDMKLYLQIQVEERALELFESWEKLEEARELRVKNREVVSEKKFEKKIKQMPTGDPFMKVKGDATHEHEFGEETYDKKKDIYLKTCKTCDHCVKYEKM